MVYLCEVLGLDLNEVMRAKVWWMKGWTSDEESLIINE